MNGANGSRYARLEARVHGLDRCRVLLHVFQDVQADERVGSESPNVRPRLGGPVTQGKFHRLEPLVTRKLSAQVRDIRGFRICGQHASVLEQKSCVVADAGADFDNAAA